MLLNPPPQRLGMRTEYGDTVRPADVAALAPHIFSMHCFVRGDLSFQVVSPMS
jgi:hypothetical protein